MKLLVLFLSLLTLDHTYAIEFTAGTGLPNNRGYYSLEKVEIDMSTLDKMVEDSIPVTEASESSYDLNSTVPFVIRNSTLHNPLNSSSRCFDDYLYAMIKMNNLRKKKKVNYHQSFFNAGYHSHQMDMPATCAPLVGLITKGRTGYWNNDKLNWVIPTHHDTARATVWCLKGKKIFFLWSPDDHDNLYIKRATVAGGISTIPDYKLHDIDLDKYPNVRKTKRHVVILGTGDILYLPFDWLHHVYTFKNTVCTTHWLDKTPDTQKHTGTPTNPYTIAINHHHEEINRDNLPSKSIDPLWWFEYKMGIRLALSNGQVVRIPNAFPNPERFDLDGLQDWEYDDKKERKKERSDARYERYKCKTCASAFENEMKKYEAFFKNLLMTDFHMNNGFSGTKYVENMYLKSHNDYIPDRIFSVVYHNTKNWDSKCGGEFIWDGGIGKQSFNPSYNTLYLFIPRQTSFHSIEKVTCGTRYGYSGWFQAKEPSDQFLLLTHSFRWANENKPGDVYNIGENMGTRNGVNEDFINDVILKN